MGRGKIGDGRIFRWSYSYHWLGKERDQQKQSDNKYDRKWKAGCRSILPISKNK